MFGNRTRRQDASDVHKAAWAVESAVNALLGPKPNFNRETRQKVHAAQVALIEADALLKAAVKALR